MNKMKSKDTELATTFRQGDKREASDKKRRDDLRHVSVDRRAVVCRSPT